MTTVIMTSTVPSGRERRGRREFIRSGLIALVVNSLLDKSMAETPAPAKPGAEVSIENFSAAGKDLGTVRVPKLTKSIEEWKLQLSPFVFEITRRAGTEAPFSGEYDKNHADGLYRCICCATALYDSATKYDSHTGWPSFWQPISALNVLQRTDASFGMVRDAISCRLCDAHLGHVFDDGPRPTGLRYCMNSVALHFVPRERA